MLGTHWGPIIGHTQKGYQSTILVVCAAVQMSLKGKAKLTNSAHKRWCHTEGRSQKHCLKKTPNTPKQLRNTFVCRLSGSFRIEQFSQEVKTTISTKIRSADTNRHNMSHVVWWEKAWQDVLWCTFPIISQAFIPATHLNSEILAVDNSECASNGPRPLQINRVRPF